MIINALYKVKNEQKQLSYLLITLIACVDSAVATLFVYPNDFAPDGIQGVGAMLQRVIGINTGYAFLALNIPLLIFAYFKLKKSYAAKNLCYVVVFSLSSIVYDALINIFELKNLLVIASNTETLILIAVFYGVVNGLVYAFTIILGGATGGTDILAAIVTYYRRSYNTVWVLFTLKVGISIASYFVYGKRILPVLVSLICSFMCGNVSDKILKGTTTALKFEVITDCPDELSREIMDKLEHGCTAITATGMYSSSDRTLLICIINKRQRIDFESIIATYPGTFAYCYPVNSTYGYFDRIK